MLGSCHNLALLDLSQNHLSGILPGELGNLSNLQVLNLKMNKLNGTITTPFQNGQLQKLLTLNLSMNSLTGSIPSQISSLSNLRFLHLQQNNLSGSIPSSIGNSPALLDLQLGGNQLSGGRHCMDMMPPLPRNRHGGPVTVGLNGVAASAADLGIRRTKGSQVGWIYGSVTEDILTGFKMHCHGWRSVYCMPKRPAFKGSAPINLSDRLHQVLRWALGSVEILFSRHCPLWYGYGCGLKWL
ncbi:hypothetical protein PIB30_099355, partial [Stylosanthes scabra]|nr:hypothetical protein [Stylosanthes scabra]